MRIDELRETLAEMAAEYPAPGVGVGVGVGAVVERGRRRLVRRRVSLAVVVLAVVGAGAGFVVNRHEARRGVVVSPTPSTKRAFVPSPTSASLPAHPAAAGEPDANRVIFTSASEGWVCAQPLLHTADGGHTWQSVSYRNLASGTHTCAAVPTDAWIVVQSLDGRVTLLPVQGGADVAVTVAIPELPADATVAEATFVDRDNGWLLVVAGHGAADHGLLYRTTTGMGPMNFALVSSVAPARGVEFSDANDGWGIDGAGVHRTTDGGATWHPVATPMPQPTAPELGVLLDHVSVRGSTVVVGGLIPSGNLSRAFFLVSTDAGATWTERDGPPTSVGTTVTSMLEVPDATHWRFAFGSEMWITDDGGSSWTKRTIPDVVSISFPTADLGWATDVNSDVVQTTDAGRTWHVVDTTPQPVWSSVLAPVPNGCPTEAVVEQPGKVDRAKEALQAAEDFVRRTRGWTGEEVLAVYPVTQSAGQFGVVFSTNVPKFCGAKVADLSYGVELGNSSVTQDSSRSTALVVAPFADGWRVWGFYR